MDFDQRQVALVLARGRAINGLVILALPGVVSRLLFGNARTTAGTKAALRMAGIRDLAMGVGAITTLKEQTMDAEWVGMGAIADVADGLILFGAPGMNARARLVGIGAAATGVVGLLASRAIADAREKPSEIDS
jgi:hypothetical protein